MVFVIIFERPAILQLHPGGLVTKVIVLVGPYIVLHVLVHASALFGF